jgi:hypothetical protein
MTATRSSQSRCSRQTMTTRSFLMLCMREKKHCERNGKCDMHGGGGCEGSMTYQKSEAVEMRAVEYCGGSSSEAEGREGRREREENVWEPGGRAQLAAAVLHQPNQPRAVAGACTACSQNWRASHPSPLKPPSQEPQLHRCSHTQRKLMRFELRSPCTCSGQGLVTVTVRSNLCYEKVCWSSRSHGPGDGLE